MKLYKSTITVWSEYDPTKVEIADLVRDAVEGDSICSGHKIELVTDPEQVPEGVLSFMNVLEEAES